MRNIIIESISIPFTKLLLLLSVLRLQQLLIPNHWYDTSSKRIEYRTKIIYVFTYTSSRQSDVWEPPNVLRNSSCCSLNVSIESTVGERVSVTGTLSFIPPLVSTIDASFSRAMTPLTFVFETFSKLLIKPLSLTVMTKSINSLCAVALTSVNATNIMHKTWYEMYEIEVSDLPMYYNQTNELAYFIHLQWCQLH